MNNQYENVTIDGTVRIENAPEPPTPPLVEKPFWKQPIGIVNAGILVRIKNLKYFILY